MGRWKGKKEKQKLKQRIQRSLSDASSTNGSTSMSSVSSPPPQGKVGFSYKDRKILLQYLKDYRDGALALYNQNTRPQTPESQEPISIASHKFPLLTDEVLRKPYLALPKDLSSKQRRVVHDMCIDGEKRTLEFISCFISALFSKIILQPPFVYLNIVSVDLFHCGVGPTRNDRIIAISIYSDGLYHVPNIIQAYPPRIPFPKYKPWGKRVNGHDPDIIHQCIDQPGVCLRDGIDSLNFIQLQDQDLSRIAPPGVHDDWMLVDTSDKMRQFIQELEVRGFTNQ
jgi:hypothetical protein